MEKNIFDYITDKGWRELLSPLFTSDYGKWLSNFIEGQYKNSIVYPKKENIFRALNETPLKDLKVVILGQDPYHDGSAVGLAFDNDVDSKYTPSYSLRNIICAVERDYEDEMLLLHPTIEGWAKQGVLLLNTALTVIEKKPESHLSAWAGFTEYLIKRLNKQDNDFPQQWGVVYMLWGKKAQAFKPMINEKLNWILESGHPAAERYYPNIFLECKHFSNANEYIAAANGKEAIIHWDKNVLV
jgi:uracil-DNA glycosylase